MAIGTEPADQKRFVRDELGALLDAFRGSIPPLYIIPGNDDWRVVEDELRKLGGTCEVTVPTGRAHEIAGGLYVVGYPCVPLTPFAIKDFEKFEGDADDYERWGRGVPRSSVLEGFKSEGVCAKEFRFDPDDITDTILNDLHTIAAYEDPAKTICLFHCPPRDCFDRTFAGMHAGSFAIRDFISAHDPLLTLHGHIHEAVSVPTPWLQCSRSTVASCGQCLEEGLYYLDIEIDQGITGGLIRPERKYAPAD